MKAADMLIDTLPRQSAFFQQQAAEKLLRAVLEVDGIPAGPTHNLRTLTDLLDTSHALRSEFLSIRNGAPQQRDSGTRQVLAACPAPRPLSLRNGKLG
jgi:HEPN domain-containing protein